MTTAIWFLFLDIFCLPGYTSSEVSLVEKAMYPGLMTDNNIRTIFDGASDFIIRCLRCGEFTIFAYAIDGLVSGSAASEYIFKPIAEHLTARTMAELYDYALHGGVYNSVADPCVDLDTVALKLVNGFCVVLFPGIGAIAYEVKTGEKRGVSAPEVENTVKGPKDAFVETVRSNTSLIRRHLRSPDLRLTELKVGRRSLTNVTVVSLQGITNPELVGRMVQRLKEIDIDGLLSPSAVEEYVTGSRSTAFPLAQYTERTDKFCQGLLDGRVGLLVDGLPLGYLLPVDLGYLMESPEDRGRDFLSASCIRVLRYAALILSLLLPAVYIAAVTYHQNWFPGKLLQIIMESRSKVPFHAATEALALLISYELLQEAGVHLPQAVGQAVSTIGGIVVGTAAVEAGLISPVILVVVSIAGVCGFVLPNRDLAQAVRLWRFGFGLVAAAAGGWGIVIGVALLLVHLGNLRSMGVAYLRIGRTGILRKKLKNQKFRDPALKPEDKRNQK